MLFFWIEKSLLDLSFQILHSIVTCINQFKHNLIQSCLGFWLRCLGVLLCYLILNALLATTWFWRVRIFSGNLVLLVLIYNNFCLSLFKIPYNELKGDAHGMDKNHLLDCVLEPSEVIFNTQASKVKLRA